MDAEHASDSSSHLPCQGRIHLYCYELGIQLAGRRGNAIPAGGPRLEAIPVIRVLLRVQLCPRYVYPRSSVHIGFFGSLATD
jgi:hypothetical protein